MLSPQTISVAIAGGLLPALLWLFFWLREDRLHPEPKKTIILSFVLGMLAVALVVPFENLAFDIIQQTGGVLVAWAIIEELFKYFAAYLGGLRTRADDEPIDALIYLITAALGFSALENVFFLLEPLSDGLAAGLITGNIRFVGATLLHTISSGIIGLSIALSFYAHRLRKIIYRVAGVFAAVVVHVLFNYFILEAGGGTILTIFGLVWLATILLLLFFEKVKRIKG